MEIRQRLKKLDTQSFNELYKFLKDFHDYLSKMDSNSGIEDYIDKEIEKFCHWTPEDYAKFDSICMGFSEHFTRGVFSYSMCTLISFAEHGKCYNSSEMSGANQGFISTNETAVNQNRLRTRDFVFNLKNIYTREKRKAVNLNNNQHYLKFNHENEKLFSFREKIIEVGNFAINLKKDNNGKSDRACGNLLILFAYDLLFLVDDYLRKLTEITSESVFAEIKKLFVIDVDNCLQTIEQKIRPTEEAETTLNKTNDLNIISQFFYDLISTEKKSDNTRTTPIGFIANLKEAFAIIMKNNQSTEDKRLTIPMVSLLNK